MVEKLLQLIKELVFVNELSRRNTDELKALRNRVDEIQRNVELLAVKIEHNRENEAHEREKLMLRLQNFLDKKTVARKKGEIRISPMAMHNPPHPGEFIAEVYLEPNHISARSLAVALNVAPSTLSRLLNGATAISPVMALRLSGALGRSPESWLAMQSNYDLWHARKKVKLGKIAKLRLSAV